MNKSLYIVVFTLDEQQYALHLRTVERVIRAAEITSLPQVPEIILGVINMEGRVIPVVNIRRRFNLLERDIHLNDEFIIAHTPTRHVALLVDAVINVMELKEEKTIKAEKILPVMPYIDGVIKLEEGMILINDLNRFLSLEEEQLLSNAMR